MKGKVLAVLGAAVVLQCAASAAMDVYIRFKVDPKAPTLEGKTSGGFLEPQASGPLSKDGWFEVKEFNCPIENKTMIGSAQSGAGAGKVTFNPFTVKLVSSAGSAALFRACCTGVHFSEVQVAMRKAGGSPLEKPVMYETFNFGLVFVSSINWSAGGGSDDVSETISFVYGSLAIQYGGGGGAGKISGWDRLGNAPINEPIPSVKPQR